MADTSLPAKGPTTGSIIGAIIGTIILIAIIGTAIAMFRKLKNDKLSGDRPPKYKPPPPQKNKSDPKQVNFSHAMASNESQWQNEYTPAPATEEVRNTHGYHDDEADDEGTHNGGYYHSGSPLDWDDPSNGGPLDYNMSDQGHDYRGPNVNREDSFVSRPMIV